MMASEPACTILMPVRNAGQTIAQTLESIAAQTLHDYELIVVDDHSSDNALAIVGDYARSDKRIQTVRNPGSGIVDALNYGLEHARSDFVARMDADDIMLPMRLERQVDYLQQHPETGVIGCQVQLFCADGVAAGYRHYQNWLNASLDHAEIQNQMFFESPLAHPSVMFRRAAVLAVGGYREGEFPEDYDLWFRLNAAGTRFQKLPEVLLRWRDSAARTSRRDSRYSETAFAHLRNQYLLRDERILSREGVWVCGAGQKTRKRVRPLVHGGMCLSGWVDIDPRKVGRDLWDVPVIHYDQLAGQEPRFFLVMVRSHGAQAQIREKLESLGYRIGQDFLPVG